MSELPVPKQRSVVDEVFIGPRPKTTTTTKKTQTKKKDKIVNFNKITLNFKGF